MSAAAIKGVPTAVDDSIFIAQKVDELRVGALRPRLAAEISDDKDAVRISLEFTGHHKGASCYFFLKIACAPVILAAETASDLREHAAERLGPHLVEYAN